MKKVEKYVCEYCHTEYTDSSKCAECEKNHMVISRIVSARYLSRSMRGTGDPVSIEVEMSNGQKLIYKRG